jgi:hypothetical protein
MIKRFLVVGVVGLGLPFLYGCGDDTGLSSRYKVSGTVNYNGKPVEKGQITFHPAQEGGATRAANGTITNGSYSLTTATPGDGALPGDYKVTIASLEVDDSKVLETVKKYGGGGRQEDIGKATAAAKNLVPAKYQLADTSKLTAKVNAKPNTINFDLTD